MAYRDWETINWSVLPLSPVEHLSQPVLRRSFVLSDSLIGKSGKGTLLNGDGKDEDIHQEDEYKDVS